ncbi:MAG: ATP phosphoribosyltransferase [Betaproteobacteria bacterium]|nr:ATP phosphoribosyltransferase [Betaproteobacteria bacterium]
MSTVLTLALSKGRIFDEAMPLLSAMGIIAQEHAESSRKLIVQTNREDLRLLLVRASDVPTYVRYGGADLGIVGSDMLLESGTDGLYQPVDLGLGRCRMSLAGPEGFDLTGRLRSGGRLRVATKYTTVARKYFAEKGVYADLIKLYGSMELAPITGLADVIVDLVSTGATLKANGLKELEVICEVSSRLVVNQASLKLHQDKIGPLIHDFSQIISAPTFTNRS